MKKFVIAAALAMFLMPAAFAGAYVGASVGQSDSTVSGVDGNDTSWKIVGGYTFMKYVGVEGSYRNFGSVDEALGTTTYVSDANSLDVFGVGILPLGKVNLFAKAGYSRIEADVTIDNQILPVVYSSSDTELAYGAGLSFGLGIADVRIEYETFDANEDLGMFSAGAVFKF